MSDSTPGGEALAAATSALLGHHLPTVLLYALLAGAAIAMLVRWHLSKRPEFANFTLMDAIAEAGRFSLERAAKSGAFIVTSIGFVHLIAIDKLSEWYFAIYAGAWISADIWRKRPDAGEGHGAG